MKKVLSIVILLGIGALYSFSQSTSISHSKAQINALKTCIDSLSIAHQKRINDLEMRMDSQNMAYRMEIKELHQSNKENCSIYYDRLDAEFDRTLVFFSFIWGLLGVLVGLVVPIIINRAFERNFTKQIEQLQEDTQTKLSNVIENINRDNKQLERLTIGRMRDRYKDIDKQLATLTKETTALKQLKIQFDEVKIKVETSERNAKQSQADAMVSRLYAEASKEYKENPLRAIELYTRLLSLDDKEMDAYVSRAFLYLRLEKYNQAIDDAIKIISIDKTNPHAYIIRGIAKNGLKLFNEAIIDFSQALQYSKDIDQQSIIYINRAESYYGLKEFDKIIEEYDLADKLSPLNANNLNNRANAYLKLGKFDLALLDATESLNICKDDKLKSCICDTIGCIYVAKEMYKEALEYFNKAIDLNDQLWECYENRANLYQILHSQAKDNEEKTNLLDMYKADIQIFRNKKIVKNENGLE
ncbi:MAG: tetratricopeptide repeat protein [Paludibacteraceae bacterium]|nr:tetratricopeptide repeat protein [Paludibacteraceae bacterium]